MTMGRSSFSAMIRSLSMLMLAMLAGAMPASAQVQPPDYDFQWRTIGAPGNRPASQQEAPQLFPPLSNPAQHIGAVGYEYRMSRTEVTNAQWLDFLNAYWPYAGPGATSPELTGGYIQVTNQTPGQNPGYRIIPGYEQVAVEVTWRDAARYCNWMTNNRASTAAAFAAGAYDTSTFITNPDGSVQDQPTHTPGAAFWLPALDEWSKGMYFDPNKGGPGVEGYWLYPTRSDTPPLPGAPGIGETSAGGPAFPVFAVGSYPNSQSPWQLLDGSGSTSEWLEDLLQFGPVVQVRGLKGSFQGAPVSWDRLDVYNTGFTGTRWGFRLASAVPAPTSIAVILLALPSILFRRSR